jgi:hypothetical protein
MQFNSISCPSAMFNRMTEVTKLLFKAARVRVKFTRESWQQLLRLHPSTMSAFIQTVNIKADLGLYIASYEERGIHLDNDCQEVRYQSGMFLILHNVRGVWYVTEVYTIGEDDGFEPVFFWTRIKRGCNVLAARVLLCWRRLTKRSQGTNQQYHGGTLYDE